tara:strand:+ start:54 stop:320 length:267 start_codon:yes stop_codon:yes gene_type:complete
MATSLPKVLLPSKEWVDIYTETGISVGTKLIIQNTGGDSARLVESASEPNLKGGFNLLRESDYLSSAESPVGVWAYAHSATTLQVEEA